MAGPSQTSSATAQASRHERDTARDPSPNRGCSASDIWIGHLGVGPAALFSTLGRVAARGIETLVLAEHMETWLDQLADNGRLVAVVVSERGVGKASLFERVGGVTSSRALFDAAVPVLPDLARRPGFVF